MLEHSISQSVILCRCVDFCIVSNFVQSGSYYVVRSYVKDYFALSRIKLAYSFSTIYSLSVFALELSISTTV